MRAKYVVKTFFFYLVHFIPRAAFTFFVVSALLQHAWLPVEAIANSCTGNTVMLSVCLFIHKKLINTLPNFSVFFFKQCKKYMYRNHFLFSDHPMKHWHLMTLTSYPNITSAFKPGCVSEVTYCMQD